MARPALPRCWAHLAGVLGGVKLYSAAIIIIKIYPALSTAVGGQDGMDCNRRFWMTLLDDVFYLWNTSSITMLGARSRHWGHWAMFFIGIYICITSYNIDIPILPFTMPQGRREWVDWRG